MARSRDLSLAELEAELRNAYVKKVLECQIREKETSREASRIRENYWSSVEKRRDLEASLVEKMRGTKIASDRETYRRELAKQISEKEITRLRVDSEERRERKLLEDQDRRFEEHEIKMKTEKRIKLMEIAKRDKMIIEEMRKTRESEKRDWEARTTREAEEYQKEMEKRAQESKVLEIERKNRRERLSAEVAKILIESADRSIENDTKIRDMVAEDIAWEMIIHEREEQARRAKMREYLKDGLARQIQAAEESTRREKEWDREFSKSVMKRVMEDERTEILTKEARARNATIYRRQLMRLIHERERMRRYEAQRIKEEYERERELEFVRVAEILEERKNLLLEHAGHVAPYINDDRLTDYEREILAEATKYRE